MRKGLCMAAIMLILCLQSYAFASPASSETSRSVERKYCLDCHQQKAGVKRFSDGSSVDTYVSSDAFMKSVHGSLSCSDCHDGFSKNAHPNRVFRSRTQYQIMASRRCRDCHADSSIKSRSIHLNLLRKEGEGEAIICTTCHSAHEIRRIINGAIASQEETACLKCHGNEGTMNFINGEKTSTIVRISDIRDSPHRGIGCSDCHRGFSQGDHPRRKFRSEREYRHSSSEICRRCHYDKYSKVSEGIHYAMLSVGRLDAPACVDCHGTHAISSPGKNRLAVINKCKNCHEDVYATYAGSIHGSALFNENNRDVAICTDCHSSHRIKDPFSSDFHDYIPDKCSSCHSNAAIMGKYGISTDVVKTYLSDFHGMTLSLYRQETQKRYAPPPAMAVCTDCHGTHNITRISGSDVQAMKAKLLKRCSSCHSGATENFPDAWLSHYTPSFRIAPMVFMIDKFYRFMLPLTVVGILFQILLDIWRYLKNR